MPEVTVVLGDITTQEVDAVVNAANSRMRGGGGVDGAIHRAGGGDPHRLRRPLPARSGHRQRRLDHRRTNALPRSLEVADDLGASTVAFPLISAGIYGWPYAVLAAVKTLRAAESDVREARIVAFNSATLAGVQTLL